MCVYVHTHIHICMFILDEVGEVGDAGFITETPMISTCGGGGGSVEMGAWTIFS